MSDAPPVEPAPSPIVAPPTGPLEPAPAPEQLAPPAIDADDPLADDLLDYGQQQFPRVVVERLRAEAANRRVRARELEAQLQPFQQAFADLPPDDVETLLAFTRTLQNDPAAAAEWMVEQGSSILEQRQQAQAAIDAPTAGDYQPDDPNRPLTRAEAEELFQYQLAQQQQNIQREQLISHWNREAGRLGYDPMARPDGPEGPMRWLQFQQLVKMAEYTGGNLEQAHNMLLEQAQGAAAAQIQQRAAQVRATVGQAPPPAPAEAQGQPESQSRRWSKVSEMVNQRLGGEPVV